MNLYLDFYYENVHILLCDVFDFCCIHILFCEVFEFVLGYEKEQLWLRIKLLLLLLLLKVRKIIFNFIHKFFCQYFRF